MRTLSASVPSPAATCSGGSHCCTAKAALYARAGIREYWVLDLAGRGLYAHRDPGADGYARIVRYAADEAVARLARPEAAVRVAELPPPAA